MNTGSRNGQGVSLLCGADGAAHTIHPQVLHIFHPDIAVVPHTAAEDLTGQLHRIEQLIVAVEHRHAAGPQILEDLALGPQDGLLTAQILHMGLADVADDGKIRLYHFPHVPNLARGVHAGLDDRRLMLRSQLQHDEGGADITVEVSLGLEGVQPLGENGGDHLLDSGLTGAAGDLYHRQGKLAPVPLGQILHGPLGIRHLNIGLIRPQGLRQAGAEAPGRSRLQCLINKIMAVKFLPHNGHKPDAGGDLPAVGGQSGNCQGLVTMQDTVDGVSHLSSGNRQHTISPFAAKRLFPGYPQGTPSLVLLTGPLHGPP